MVEEDLETHVKDPARLAALRAVALLDTPAEEAFDRLSRLAVRFADVPVALVALVDADRQFFKSAVGLPEPWQSLRETPLSHSFCKHNRIPGRPLVLTDARRHPEFSDNLAIENLGAVAYLGIPLVTSDGYVLGSFCVIDRKPRQWTREEIEVIEDLAAAVMTEIQLRAQIAEREKLEGERDELAELAARLRGEIAARIEAEEEQRRLEERLLQGRKMEAIGGLAGGVAHDLNNLLLPILGYGELLAEDPTLGKEQQESVAEILRAVHHARDLVSRLLTFSRKQRVELRPLDINAVVGGFGALLRHTIPEDVHIDLQLGSEIPPVLADGGQIEQILMNLAVNASDAMPEGGTLTIITEVIEVDEDADEVPTLEPGHYVVLTLRDTGHGMDASTRERAFDPFFSTKAERGTGLGLATVFGIVSQHGGGIQLTSEPGEGTTIRVLLPALHGAVAQEQAWRLNENADLEGTETVLVAEDNDAVRGLARAVLERRGYRVLSAADGETALALLRSHAGPVHLLLTDVVMPGMNGRELYAKAVEEREDLEVLYMSGYTDDVLAHRGVSDSTSHFLQKPFSTRELARKVREILEG